MPNLLAGALGGSTSLFTIHGPLAVGSRGQDVRLLQEMLNQTGCSPKLQPDGAFGIKTDTAVRAFQRSKKLKVDGIVGPLTTAALGLKYEARPFAPPMPTPGPSRPNSPLVIPTLPGKPDQSAISQLVEAIIQGFSAIQNGVIQTVLAISELPSAVLNEIRSRLSGPFQAAIQALRSCVSSAVASATGAANIITATLRASVRGIIAILGDVAGLIGRLPDILGLTGVVDKIKAIISRVQTAVNSVIDFVIKTLSGVGESVFQAVAFIIGVLRSAAAF